MFRKPQRYFFVAFLFVISTPLIAGLIAPQTGMIVEKEQRPPNALPAWPSSSGDLSKLPAKLDAYLADRFGLRHEMVRLYANLNRRLLRGGDENVLVGDHGRMFFKSDNTLDQSAGLIRRDKEVAETVNLLTEMNDILKRKSVRFIVASPPNSSSVYIDDLPPWARPSGRVTEYDLWISALRARGVDVVDLRPALKRARYRGNLYFLYDTHWTPRGAIIGFNAIAQASGRPRWKLDVQSSLLAPTPRPGGDLARMIGVDEDVSEPLENIALPANPEIASSSGHGAPTNEPSFSQAGRPGGETLLIVGDSFTRGFFPPLLIKRVGRIVWMHHTWCGLDWSLVDQVHPDEVWWMPTERYFVCLGGRRPEHFPNDVLPRASVTEKAADHS